MGRDPICTMCSARATTLATNPVRGIVEALPHCDACAQLGVIVCVYTCGSCDEESSERAVKRAQACPHCGSSDLEQNGVAL